MLAGHSAGSTWLLLSSEAVMEVGHRLTISGEADSEERTIAGFTGFGGVVLDAELAHSYPAGTMVTARTSDDSPAPTPANDDAPAPTPANDDGAAAPAVAIAGASAPAPAPLTLDELIEWEDMVVERLLNSGGDAGSIVADGSEVTIIAQTLAAAASPPPAAGGSGSSPPQGIAVNVPGMGVQVVFPSTLFQALGESEVVAVVSVVQGETMEEMAVLPALPDGTLLEGAVSRMNINIMSRSRDRLVVEGLLDPIIFSMPNTSAYRDLRCGWLDEELVWREDGVWVYEHEPGDNLVCATSHLTFFGALLTGILSTLECGQATLLSAESYRELANIGEWATTPGAGLVFLLLGLIGSVFACACYMDFQEARRDMWKPEYFLVADNAPPPPAEAAAESEGCCCPGEACCEAAKTSLKEALDDLFGGFFEYFGDVRSLCEEMWNALSADCGNAQGLLVRTTLALLESSAHKQACASCFISPDDADWLFDDSVEELLEEKDNNNSNEGEKGEEAKKKGEEEEKAPQARAEKGGEPVAEDSHAVRGESSGPQRQSSVGSLLGDDRHRKIMEWRDMVELHRRQQTQRHGNWAGVPKMALVSFAVHNPLGQVFCRSILTSHSMRALLLACDWLGAAMLATLFASASGGAQGKRSPKGCDASCEEQAVEEGADSVTYCVAFHIGRIVVIGTASAIVASLPVSLISCFHSREFKRVDYEGSPAWNRQLARWRRADVATWVVGLAYCAFAVNFTVLFFANVAPLDQEDWLMSALIGFGEDFVVFPLVSGIVLAAAALLLLSGLALRYGLPKHDLTRWGEVEQVRKVFSLSSDKSEVRQAFHEHPDLNSFIRSKTGTSIGGSILSATDSARTLGSEEVVRGEPTMKDKHNDGLALDDQHPVCVDADEDDADAALETIDI